MEEVILSKSEKNCDKSLGLFNNKNEIVTFDGEQSALSPVAKIGTQPFFILTIMQKNTGTGKMFEKTKLKFLRV